MVDKVHGTDVKSADPTTAAATPAATATVPPPRRPGHRGADVRDTVAEMAARAQEISLEAGSKIAAAMKDVIGAAAGLTGFALESARDLVQYMVRRGQMTQDEADKLIREVEESQPRRTGVVAARPTQPRAADVVRPEPPRAEAPRTDTDGKKHVAAPPAPAPARPAAKAARPAAKAASRPAKKAAPARSAARPKPAAKKAAAKAKKKR
jgi:hypothetical protein